MDYFDEFKVIGLGKNDNAKSKVVTEEEQKKKAKRKEKDITLKEIEKINAYNRIY